MTMAAPTPLRLGRRLRPSTLYAPPPGRETRRVSWASSESKECYNLPACAGRHARVCQVAQPVPSRCQRLQAVQQKDVQRHQEVPRGRLQDSGLQVRTLSPLRRRGSRHSVLPDTTSPECSSAAQPVGWPCSNQKGVGKQLEGKASRTTRQRAENFIADVRCPVLVPRCSVRAMAISQSCSYSACSCCCQPCTGRG